MMRWLTTTLAILALGAFGCAEEALGGDRMSDVVDGNNRFATDLYAQLRQQPGNLFYSPYSLSTALAMTYAGAHGQTAQEMAGTLHFSSAPQALHAGFRALIQKINGDGKPRPYQLAVANALWGQQGEPFLREFLQFLETNYGAGLREVDFLDVDQARKTINQWVEEHTQQKIKDLLAPPYPYPNTSLILTNAIYFKGNWATPFSKQATHDAEFTIAPDQKVRVPLMNRTDRLAHYDEGTFQAVELSYAGGDLSMVVLLPKDPSRLGVLEESLTAAKLAGWIGKLQPVRVNLSLPRFKIEASFALQDTLAKMGMPLAFTGDADFSGMDGRHELFIAAVLHKAFVDVNEEGTEVAAATAVVMARAIKAIEPTITFRADHPFLFLIRHVPTGSILFLGRITDPRG